MWQEHREYWGSKGPYNRHNETALFYYESTTQLLTLRSFKHNNRAHHSRNETALHTFLI